MVYNFSALINTKTHHWSNEIGFGDDRSFDIRFFNAIKSARIRKIAWVIYNEFGSV